jgi:hypothetical protein
MAAVVPGEAQSARPREALTPARTNSTTTSFLDILRVPDSVTAFGRFDKTLPADAISLERKGDHWSRGRVAVETTIEENGLVATLNAPATAISVELGERSLRMATVVSRKGGSGESAVDAARALCQRMCARASRPLQPIYGANDWCYSYGRSTAETILRDTDFTVELSPTGAVRPFSVIDGGWENGTAACRIWGSSRARCKQ